MRLLLRSFTLLATLAIFPATTLHSGAFLSGTQTCPSSGAKRVASATLKISWGYIQAPSANTGTISFGSSSVTTTTGIVATAGSGLNLPPVSNTAFYDLSQVYFACTQSADTLVYAYAQ